MQRQHPTSGGTVTGSGGHSGPFVLAHLSDPHVATPLAAHVGHFVNKRAVGYLSWRLSRSRIHRFDVLSALQRDVIATGADHTVVTGDIVNVSLEHEFEAAATWLSGFGAPSDVTVVPGNHDAYVNLPWDRSLSAWADFMTSDGLDGTSRLPSGLADFPLLRRRGPLALIGISTAMPSAPGMAYGEVGQGQLQRLERLLREMEDEGRFRVVLIHHPAIDADTPPRKRLRDGAAFRRVVASAGAELILHGHNHKVQIGTIEGPRHPAHVFGVPSASAVRGDTTRIARYHLYRIAQDDTGWTMTVLARVFDPGTGGFYDQDVCTIPAPPAPHLAALDPVR